MKMKIKLVVVTLLLASLCLFIGYYSPKIVMNNSKGIADSPTNTAQVETIVRNYLLKNPEIIYEVQTAFEAKQEGDAKAAQTDYLKQENSDLFRHSQDPVLGNPKGDVTVVEFFDYNCTYCRHALKDMDALIKADPNVRFVLKELPILGADSVEAHKVAQAFWALKPEKYGEFHRALLSSGHANRESAIQVAESLGISQADLKTALKNPNIQKLFEMNNQMASRLKITGTPAYVIKDTVALGAIGFDGLSQKVKNVRTCSSAVCP
jgi:protein-disulfide isomerase